MKMYTMNDDKCKTLVNGKTKLQTCNHVISGNRKSCLGFQKRIKRQFALIF